MEGKLDHITIKGFKSIASIEKIPLKRINILIGANGSGKSNFIGAFGFLHAIREGRLQDYVVKAGGAEKVLHYGSKRTKELCLELSFQGGMNGYQLTLSPTEDDALHPSGEFVFFKGPGYDTPWNDVLSPRERGREAGISNPKALRTSGWVRARMGLWRVYHFHDTSSSSPMRKTSRVDDNEFLRPEGSNLASFLYLLKNKHESCYGMIRRTVQLVAPFFDDFRLEPRRLKPEDIRLEWKHRNSDQYFDASSFSDGTLRFIVLATLFLQPAKLLPSVILVDEPELGLHPYAIEMLSGLAKQASGKAQVVMSTQSTLLLDHFSPDDILVANRVSGGTRIERLKESRLKVWLEDYSLGQLWEKNQLSGRPGPE